MNDGKDAMRALITEAHRSLLNTCDILWAAGYRLDPYPDGLTKDELINIATTCLGALATCRIMLAEEHRRHVDESCGITMDKHRELHPDCRYCGFVADHSLVKS